MNIFKTKQKTLGTVIEPRNKGLESECQDSKSSVLTLFCHHTEVTFSLSFYSLSIQ